jgi:hypothetical protein
MNERFDYRGLLADVCQEIGLASYLNATSK